MASKRVIEVVIKVKDQASKGFDKFASGAKKAKDGLKGISLTAAATAAAVVFAVKKMVDSFLSGSSYGDIAIFIGVSEQRVRSVLNRRGYTYASRSKSNSLS